MLSPRVVEEWPSGDPQASATTFACSAERTHYLDAPADGSILGGLDNLWESLR